MSDFVGELIPMQLELDSDAENVGHVHDESKVAYQHEKAGFIIRCHKTLAIHGHLKGPTSSPASLIVLHFKLTQKNSSKEQRRWSSLYVKLRYQPQDTDETGDSEGVTIWSYQPAWEGEIYLTESTAKINNTRTYSFTTALTAPPPVPASVSFTAASSETKDYVKRYLYTVQADRGVTTKVEGEDQGADYVYWNSIQNSIDGVGIGDLKVSMVVERENDKPFEIRVEHKASVTWRYKVATEDWKWFRGKRESILTKFDPAVDFGPLPDGVDKNHLAEVETNGILERLADVHQPELWVPPGHSTNVE